MAINVEPALSPHLVVDDAASAIDFYVKAFDAVELGRVPGPDGKLIHAALRINGFTVMLNDDVPQMCGGKSMTPTSLGGTPVTIHLTVTDVDAKFQRALNAGATVVTALEDQLWETATGWSPTRSATTGRWASRCARSTWMRSKPPCHHKGTVSTIGCPRSRSRASTRRRSGSLGALVAAASISATSVNLLRTRPSALPRAISAASMARHPAQPMAWGWRACTS